VKRGVVYYLEEISRDYSGGIKIDHEKQPVSGLVV
jgi:hypothetical protein